MNAGVDLGAARLQAGWAGVSLGARWLKPAPYSLKTKSKQSP